MSLKDAISPVRNELAEQYRAMVGLAAWRHFESIILTRIDEQATKDEDSIILDELTPAKIAECRGRRKAIAKIKSDLNYILNGG